MLQIGGRKYNLKMKYVLRALVKTLEQRPLARSTIAKVQWDPYPLSSVEQKGPLTQDYLWAVSRESQRPLGFIPNFEQAVGRFLPPGDFVIAETGTSAYGIPASPFPSGASGYNQTVFGSIGYATGAAVGSFQAIKESGKYKRCILFTGEGSLQLTVQAFADMLKLKVHPIV
jgi:pyruvate decarboxylase